ncbi:GAF domain-containing protein [Pacificoceanicola onchidii]|uniref:GAF domain-containing protein n=1 Tax=Pacificoceanicola onchidii TaxID=2562685 RepID=UPI0010A6722D|nr:GAF domain-containing protein [Pacificoceanicola onchidii]
MVYARHADKVAEAALSDRAAAHSMIVASWRRSMLAHDLDPSSKARGLRLTASEQAERREASASLLSIASPLLDDLHMLVAQSGCGVFLSDAEGVVLEQRMRDGDAAAFDAWNLWSGAHWGEEHEGTNGIGTCLAEGRRVVIHRDEHFAARNTAMSCIDAPIHDACGRIVGALDVSSARSDQSGGMNRLMAEAVTQCARKIETGLFRASFPDHRIMMADEDGAALLAVDADDVVQGANRAARRQFGLGPRGTLAPRPAVDLLGHAPEHRGFDRGSAAAIRRALLRNDGNASAAARELGIGRATFYRKLRKLGIATG